MTIHTGVAFAASVAGKEESFGTNVVDGYPKVFLKGTWTQIISPAIVSIHSGKVKKDVYEVLLEDKIYVSQTDFAYDLITEDITETITLWNAAQVPHTLLDISIVGGETGINLTGISSPYPFTAETTKDITLTIYKDGPAIQNTTITLVFDNLSVVITIFGIRIVPFPFDANFNDLTISYQIKSIIFDNDKFEEQRRPYSEKVMREISANFLFNLYAAQFFVNSSRSMINKVLGIGVYSEPIHPIASDIYNLANIVVSETLTYYWNLSKSQYILILDLETNVSELKEILSYSTNTIVLKYPIYGHFLKANTVIYPAIVGIISEKDFTAETGRVVSASLKFREVSL